MRRDAGVTTLVRVRRGSGDQDSSCKVLTTRVVVFSFTRKVPFKSDCLSVSEHDAACGGVRGGGGPVPTPGREGWGGDSPIKLDPFSPSRKVREGVADVVSVHEMLTNQILLFQQHLGFSM